MQPTLLSKVFVLCDNNVLVLFRSDSSFNRPGSIDIPGGHVDTGETPAIAVCRELLEEVGVTIAEPDVTLVYAATEFAHNINIIRFTFMTRLSAEPSIELSHEHKAYEWIKLDDPRLNNLPIDYISGLRHAVDHNLA